MGKEQEHQVSHEVKERFREYWVLKLRVKSWHIKILIKICQINKIRNEKEVTTNTTEIQRTIRDYYK